MGFQNFIVSNNQYVTFSFQYWSSLVLSGYHSKKSDCKWWWRWTSGVYNTACATCQSHVTDSQNATTAGTHAMEWLSAYNFETFCSWAILECCHELKWILQLSLEFVTFVYMTIFIYLHYVMFLKTEIFQDQMKRIVAYKNVWNL